MRVYGQAPRGEGRQTPSARGSITFQYYPLQIFYKTVFLIHFHRKSLFDEYRSLGRDAPVGISNRKNFTSVVIVFHGEQKLKIVSVEFHLLYHKI
jgi:hypothetical protein